MLNCLFFTRYTDITSNNKFYAVAFILRGQIIGLVVAEIKDALKLPKEDSAILAPTFRKGTKIGYILSLGESYNFLPFPGIFVFGRF